MTKSEEGDMKLMKQRIMKEFEVKPKPSEPQLEIEEEKPPKELKPFKPEVAAEEKVPDEFEKALEEAEKIEIKPKPKKRRAPKKPVKKKRAKRAVKPRKPIASERFIPISDLVNKKKSGKVHKEPLDSEISVPLSDILKPRKKKKSS